MSWSRLSVFRRSLKAKRCRIKIDGFNGGDRTSLDLPAPQQKLLEAVAATGKPLIVVLQSGSAVALNWANEHAAAILEAWYPGVEGGTAIARTLAGLNNPAGRLPVTFYASLDGLPAFTDYSTERPHLSLLQGQAAVGLWLRLELLELQIRPGEAFSSNAQSRRPDDRNGDVTNTGTVSGDEVVEAYLKTPQESGPIHSLVGFDRVTIGPGSQQGSRSENRSALAIERRRPGQPLHSRRQIHADSRRRAAGRNKCEVGSGFQRNGNGRAAKVALLPSRAGCCGLPRTPSLPSNCAVRPLYR